MLSRGQPPDRRQTTKEHRRMHGALLLLAALAAPLLAGAHSSPPGHVRGAHWHCDPPDGSVREVVCELDRGLLGHDSFPLITFADRTAGSCRSLWREVSRFIHNYRRIDRPDIPPSQEIIPAGPGGPPVGPAGNVLRFTAAPAGGAQCIQAVASYHVQRSENIQACRSNCDTTRTSCATTCTNGNTSCRRGCTTARSDCRTRCNETLESCRTGCTDPNDTNCQDDCLRQNALCNDDCGSNFGVCTGDCGTVFGNCNDTCSTNNTVCRNDYCEGVYELALSPVFTLDPDYGEEPQSTRRDEPADGPRHLPFVFAHTLNGEHPQGFVRIANLNATYEGTALPPPGDRAEPIELAIRAFDERGSGGSTVNRVRLNPGEAMHFNSRDLEEGNEVKQIGNAFGDLNGHWRLEIEPVEPSAPGTRNFFVGAYARSPSGFLTVMHDHAERLDYGDGGVSLPHLYPVPIFNPGGNRSQVSHLRVTNLDPDNARRYYLAASDGNGDRRFRILGTVQPKATRQWTARDLEGGSCGINDGAGKWFLVVGGGPALVTHLVESTTASTQIDGTVGLWSNLTAAPPDPANLGEADEIRNLFYRANEDYEADCARNPSEQRCNARHCG